MTELQTLFIIDLCLSVKLLRLIIEFLEVIQSFIANVQEQIMKKVLLKFKNREIKLKLSFLTKKTYLGLHYNQLSQQRKKFSKKLGKHKFI